MTKDQILNGLKNKDRTVLAKAMTLFESVKIEDRKLSSEILKEIQKDDYSSRVLGITGTPGVGKSTFLNSFGKKLVENKKSLAILTIDPSSEKTGGSILGDKTRMSDLIEFESVFIRPSASGALLGGTSAKTRDLVTLCEAFGFDYIFVESVGVGQSEVQLAKMVDFLFLFLAPGGGDDLQGIKKGVLEHTDLLVINKADQDKTLAMQTASLYGQSLERTPCVISALNKEGLENISKIIDEIYSDSQIKEIRSEKRKAFFWDRIEIEMKHKLSGAKNSKQANQILEDYLKNKNTIEECLDQILRTI